MRCGARHGPNLSGRVVVLESPKKRRRGVFRAMPVPPELLDALDMVHDIREAQRRGQVQALLWPWSRMTGFRRVQEVIAAAGIPRLPQGPAARLRRAGGQPGHRAQHDSKVVGPRPAHHHGDLRQRRR